MTGYAGRQGRKPLPTAIRALRGNQSHRPFNPQEPVVTVALPPMPPQLSPGARKEWRRMGAELVRLGIMTGIDRAAFAAYCQEWARWEAAEEAIKEHGLLFKGPGGVPIPSPYLRIARDALDRFTRILTEFGMTPSSRSRVKVGASGEKDAFEDLLSGRSGAG